MPEPTRVTVKKLFPNLKAKDLKQRDNVLLINHNLFVQSVRKNDFGERVVILEHSPRETITMIVPKDFTFRVTRSKDITPKKK